METNSTSQKIWFITGSGSGLGRKIAEAALYSGNKVAATALNPDDLSALRDQYGNNVEVIKLNVNDEKEARSAVQTALKAFGRIDVLINNAGYGDIRPFEQITSEEFRALVETCFFGAVTLTREVLPSMRNQRSGHIIQISSLGGRTAFAGNSPYYAAKWALGGFTESLALEIAPFGIHITCLEPGAMRTSWGKLANRKNKQIMPEYESSVGSAIKALENIWGNESGDPEKVASVIVKLVENDHLPPHILLGSDSFNAAMEVESNRQKEAELWKSVSISIDFENHEPIPNLPV
jgi:NAD(P)-dependent dehydrogenase (short-subunit alcohol dehydrogenase family)